MIDRPLRRAVAAFALTAASAGPASAIFINDSDLAVGAQETMQALGAPFESVVKVNFAGSTCFGSLIAPTAVLTAKHCIGSNQADDVTVRFFDSSGVNDLNRGVDQIHPFDLSSSPDAPDTDLDSNIGLGFLNGLDLAILQLDSQVSAAERTPLRLFDGGQFGDVGRAVGFGQNGVGRAAGESATINNADNTRRAADNEIEFVLLDDTDNDGVGDTVVPNLIGADFDKTGGVANEGALGPGDSGGPLMLEVNGEWVITGVASALVWNPADFTNNPPIGEFGTFSFWTGVFDPAARAFIESKTQGLATYAPVPLPAAGWLLIGAVAALGALRRRAA